MKPTELEIELYKALAIVIDATRFPAEKTKLGLTIASFSPEQIESIETAYRLFSVIHGQKLSLGNFIEVLPDV